MHIIIRCSRQASGRNKRDVHNIDANSTFMHVSTAAAAAADFIHSEWVQGTPQRYGRFVYSRALLDTHRSCTWCYRPAAPKPQHIQSINKTPMSTHRRISESTIAQKQKGRGCVRRSSNGLGKRSNGQHAAYWYR